MNIESLKKYWVNDNLNNIKPNLGSEFPEGFDPRLILNQIYKWCNKGKITELGCGYGRLADAFPNDCYLGLDLNPKAIEKAIVSFNKYQFKTIDTEYDIPKGDILVAYTVFLHIPNEILSTWLKAIKAKYDYIIICEILGSNWRLYAGETPVFNREKEEYIKMLEPFNLEMEILMPYKRYVNSDFTKLNNELNTDISFLVFSKENNFYR